MSALSPLTLNQQLVLDAIHNDPGVTLAEIADETELSEGRVRQALVKLEGLDLVMLLGGDTETRFVTKSGSAAS